MSCGAHPYSYVHAISLLVHVYYMYFFPFACTVAVVDSKVTNVRENFIDDEY